MFSRSKLISLFLVLLSVFGESAYGGPIIFDFSSGQGTTVYAGMYSDGKTGFCTGLNMFYILINGGLEYNILGNNGSVEGFLGTSPIFISAYLLHINKPMLGLISPNAIQTQIGYGGNGMVLKVRTDLNIANLFQDDQPLTVPRKKERKGLHRLMLTAGYEFYPNDHPKNNWQVGLGLLF